MKVLFQCNTVYQLLTAIQVKECFYNKDEVDLLISDIMNDSKKLKERICEKQMFNNVYLQNIKSNKITWNNKLYSSKKRRSLFIDFDCKNCHYDLFICSNPSFENLALFSILPTKNRNIRFFLMEDGLSTYSRHYYKLCVENLHGIKRFVSFHRYLKFITQIYTYREDLFMWKYSGQINIIPPLTSINCDLLSKINYIFDYKCDTLPNDCKVIFFEEGYFGDKKDVNDVEIIEECISRFGTKGFYVKIHPRNRINRFDDLSIRTLHTMSIPWELIVLNNIEKVETLKLITIASASMFTPVIMFGIHPKSYSCINMINDRKYLFSYIPEVEEILIKSNKEIEYLAWR